MIWSDDCFPYSQFQGKFNTLYMDNYKDGNEERENVVDYNENLHLYRVSHFLNGHWDGDVVFKEKTNAYCPLCDEERYIPDYKGYCCKCGHHLNRQEK